jgi:hypothetical protein
MRVMRVMSKFLIIDNSGILVVGVIALEALGLKVNSVTGGVKVC